MQQHWHTKTSIIDIALRSLLSSQGLELETYRTGTRGRTWGAGAIALQATERSVAHFRRVRCYEPDPDNIVSSCAPYV